GQIQSHANGMRLDLAGERAALDFVPAGWATRSSMFEQCAVDSSDEWICTLKSSNPAPNVAILTVCAPFFDEELNGAQISCTTALLALAKEVGESEYHSEKAKRWSWRNAYFPRRSSYHELLRRTVGASPIMPRVHNPERTTIGILLPIASFGGVEKVAYAFAKVLKDNGYELHLFIFGEPTYRGVPDAEGVFESINFLAAEYNLWGGPHVYQGHEILLGSDPEAQSDLILGLLCGLDVIVNCQVAPANAVLAELRRRGAKIVGYWHVMDKNNVRRDVGHPYIALAFEHVYHLMLTCSESLCFWLHSMGVPQQKLMHIPNAPSYSLAPQAVEEICAQRKGRIRKALSVIFLGRFDRQKGIERIHDAVRESFHRQLPIKWRIIGSEVIESGLQISWSARFEAIGVKVEEPLYDSDLITRAISEADIMILPSRWEGAPLSIIDAQRLGCVPVVTDVGAVGELIDDEVDGVLISEGSDKAVAEQLIHVLMELVDDPSKLSALSSAACTRVSEISWSSSVSSFVEVMQKWFPGPDD
ncbi:glycosyltransferase family 4 protein, partial [Methylobacterium oxalidis]|uniref:glycosyltransferase family 4 protein n=1 Tax=Methylobacterium oxalidis TaxID=944322 RepID=UPI001EE01A3F